MPPNAHRSAKLPLSKQLCALNALISQGHYVEAEYQARELTQHYPKSGDALGILGLALVQQELYEEALPLLKKALSYTSDRPAAIIATLGLCQAKQGYLSDAVAFFQEALAKEPHRVSARNNLGNVYLETGAIGKARQCFAENLRYDPININSHYNLSQFIKYKSDDKIFSQLPELLENVNIADKDKATLCFMLGKAYWDIHEFDTAFAYYQWANQYFRQHKRAISLPETGLLEEVTRNFTAECYEKIKAGGSVAIPQLTISGLSRSGKSLVESFFSGVEGVEKKGESQQLRLYVKSVLADYEGGVTEYLETLTPEQCAADAQGYLDFIEYAGNVHTITRPMDIWALGFIGLWFPTAPIVFCQRDMFDLGLTAYFNRYTEGNDYTEDLYTLGEHIAYYEQVMQHWSRVLPNPIYWVSYEELSSDPQSVAARLLKALDKPENSAWEEAAKGHAEFVEHLSPVRSLDVPMPIRQDFNGIAEPFMHHLGPLRDGYQAVMKAHGLPCEPIEHFDWQLKGRLVVVDNAARLPREDNFRELMAANAFGVVAFDPASRVATEDVADLEEFQHVPHALLGDGQPATLYATLDANFTAPLEPLPPEHLPDNIRSGSTVLTRVPINTLRLDDIEGLSNLDWLILDELSDAIAVLENGTQALADTLLLQVGVAFTPTHKRQPNLAEVCHWASRHGFAFYRLNNPRHRSLLPEREDVTRHQATQLASADALFIPAPERMSALDQKQRQCLAFILDTVFGIHDLSYQLLAEDDPEAAERYLKVRGYKGVQPNADIAAQPSFLALRKPVRVAEKGLAAAIANHNIHRAVGLAQQLLKEVPNDPEGRYYLGQALSLLGQHEQAIATLTKLFDEEKELRYGVALGYAQWRAGNTKLAKRVHEVLRERFPDHLAVQQLGLELVKHSAKHRELEEGLVQCDALLAHSDSSLVAAGLGDAVAARAGLMEIKAALLKGLADTQTQTEQALQTYFQALEQLQNRQGPLRTSLLAGMANVQRQLDKKTEAVASLWQACNSYPYSLETVTAYKQLRKALAESPAQEHQRLAKLHANVQKIWHSYHGEQLQYSFGDYGLPYQGFEPLMLPGTRSANTRLAQYQLEKWLPDNATALDIGCNHGFLLMGLADRLKAGEGFDISKACVEVGNLVAKHLNHSHITLYHKAFDDFVGKKQYDLVIACAVHQWIGKPLENFGDSLLSLCKPGGIVLLESQGARDRYKTEPGFEDNATAIASAGFNVLDKGAICDDSLNYREFWILQRHQEPMVKSAPNKRQKTSLSLPIMEGEAEALNPMRDICRLLAKNGAWFNPDLRIQSVNGNLSLHGTPGALRASYMRVPVALMPQLECFDISSREGMLVATPNGMPMLPHQQEMMEAMMALYNATDKLQLWGESLPFSAWEAPSVLKYLLSARPLNTNLARYYQHFEAGEQDELLVDSFLGSRKFGVRKQALEALGVKGDVQQRNALLPLVDCLNHRLSAEGYYTPMVGGKPTMRTFNEPDAETGELFVRYNLYDAVDTTLIYGFMDRSCSWLASIPVSLNVSGQRIDVQGVPMYLSGPLPAAFEDIRTYMPALHRKSEHHAEITKLMLCTQNPQSLRRVLRYLVYILGVAHTELVARQQVAELEKQLIEKNLQWWHEFARLTDALPSEHPAKQLGEHSLGIIRKYQEAVA